MKCPNQVAAQESSLWVTVRSILLPPIGWRNRSDCDSSPARSNRTAGLVDDNQSHTALRLVDLEYRPPLAQGTAHPLYGKDESVFHAERNQCCFDEVLPCAN